jgi:hypothetical protein
MPLLEIPWIYVVGAVVISLLMLSSRKEQTSTTVIQPKPIRPMNFTLKKVKCSTCNRQFKSKNVDIQTVIDDCQNPHCALKHEEMAHLLKLAKAVVNPEIKDGIEIEIPDPIVMILDKNGNIKRTVP